MPQRAHRHASTVGDRTWLRRSLTATVPVLGVATVLGAGIGAALDRPQERTEASPTRIETTQIDRLETQVSRSLERRPQVTGRRVALTDGVPVKAAPAREAELYGRLERGTSVQLTDARVGAYAGILRRGEIAWVPKAALAERLPLGTQPCAGGSGVESGLQPDTVKVHRAVCERFPQIATYGGTSGSGEHATGQALDIMVSGPLGDQVAAFLQENQAALGIEYLIWEQRIWRPATSSAWRPMSDRGSATANHFDHVHVTTYGSAAR